MRKQTSYARASAAVRRKTLAERGANPEAGILKTAPQAASLQPLDRLPSFLLPVVEQNKSSLPEATESLSVLSPEQASMHHKHESWGCMQEWEGHTEPEQACSRSNAHSVLWPGAGSLSAGCLSCPNCGD